MLRSTALAGMGQRADRNQIDAGLGDCAHGLERDAAGGFEDDAPGGAITRARAHLVERHVVEQDRIGPGGQRLLDLRQRLAFDFDA